MQINEARISRNIEISPQRLAKKDSRVKCGAHEDFCRFILLHTATASKIYQSSEPFHFSSKLTVKILHRNAAKC